MLLKNKNLCLLILGFLVACQPAPPVDPHTTPSSTPSVEEPSPDTSASADTDTGAAQEVPSIERQKEANLSLPPPVDDNPDRFLEATPAALIAELGEPRLRRRESPAEVWQYRTRDCVLDFCL